MRDSQIRDRDDSESFGFPSKMRPRHSHRRDRDGLNLSPRRVRDIFSRRFIFFATFQRHFMNSTFLGHFNILNCNITSYMKQMIQYSTSVHYFYVLIDYKLNIICIIDLSIFWHLNNKYLIVALIPLHPQKTLQ